MAQACHGRQRIEIWPAEARRGMKNLHASQTTEDTQGREAAACSATDVPALLGGVLKQIPRLVDDCAGEVSHMI
jgi:hypothetical protein